MMDRHSSNTASSGEEKLKSRTRSFWTFIVLGIVAAMFAGFVSGYFTHMVKDGTMPLWAFSLTILVVVIGLIWFSYRYYMRIDEFDLTDNLWGNTFGLYAYVIITSVWLAFAEAGITREPQHIPILFATIVVSLIGYTYRRMR